MGILLPLLVYIQYVYMYMYVHICTRRQIYARPSDILTCGVRLAVVLPAVLHLDGRQTQRLDHLVRPLAPVGGAERADGQREGQRGEGQGEQGAVAPRHVFQHGWAAVVGGGARSVAVGSKNCLRGRGRDPSTNGGLRMQKMGWG